MGNLLQVYTCHGRRGNPHTLHLAMLTAYFDESGTGSPEKLCCVSGFVGNEAQWNAFIADWIENLGQREFLHMKKLRWNSHYNKIAADLATLGAIPHKYNLKPISVQVWHRDYDELVKGKVIDEIHPYTFCAQACIALALENMSISEEIMFIFDWQEGRRAEWMTRLHDVVFKWNKFDSRVKDIDFRRMKSTPCLEVADYLAFAVREFKIDRTSPRAMATAPVLAAKRGLTGTYSRTMLKDLADSSIAHGMTLGNKPQKMHKELIRAMEKERWQRIYAKNK